MRSHLDASGIIWRHLEASGGIWRNLETSGIIWRHLESSGGIQGHLQAPGSIQRHLKASAPLEASGAIWRHLEEAARGTQEAPRWRPGGTQQAPKRHPDCRRHLGGIWRSDPRKRRSLSNGLRNFLQGLNFMEVFLMVPLVMYACLQQHLLRDKKSVLDLESWPRKLPPEPLQPKLFRKTVSGVLVQMIFQAGNVSPHFVLEDANSQARPTCYVFASFCLN